MQTFDAITASGSDDFTKAINANKNACFKYKLTSPGVSSPGPSFIELVDKLVDPGTDKDYWYNYYYLTALYSDDFGLNVTFKNTEYPVDFIPGHIWGEQRSKPDAYGPSPADVMILGKLPGYDETLYKINLTGPSGLALREAFEEIGVDPSSYYITNLIKFPHPDRRSSIVPATWIKDCLPLLQLELRVTKPKFLLCLGTEATQSILGKDKNVTNTVGQCFDIEIPINATADEPAEFHKIKVVTCVHPAAVLRTPDLYSQFIQSLQFFRKITNGEAVGIDEKDLDHTIVRTEEDLKRLVDTLLQDSEARTFAVDAEWHGEYPFEPGSYLRTIQFSVRPKQACCVVLADTGGTQAFSPNNDAAINQLRRLLKSTRERRVRIVGHFFRSDLPWLLRYGLDLRPEYMAPEDEFDDKGNIVKFGWEKTTTEGGFDTGQAAHAVTETARFKLEVLGATLLGTPRYDSILSKWKDEYCKTNKISSEDMEGYGMVPDDILYPYSMMDADLTRRLFDLYNGTEEKVGLLDSDYYGNSSREAFWVSMRAAPAFLEMEQTGIAADLKRAEDLTLLYRDAESILLEGFRQTINWPSFNHKSNDHLRELLFGEMYHNKYDEKGSPVKYRPDNVETLGLPPVKSTGKPSKPWAVVVNRRETDFYKPSCDKESLGILSAVSPEARELRNLKFISHVLQSSLRKPKSNGDGQDERDEDGNLVFEKGLLSYVSSDGAIHTHLYSTKETGRASSSRPNLTNLGKRREQDYKKILGAKYKHPIRSILTARPGHVLIEADYSGAEVLGMALMANDKNLIDHAQRSALPEDHPNYYDIHSNIAVEAFQLDCPPTKSGLDSIDCLHLRTGAKTVFFGYAYGQGAEAAARKAQEEGAKVTVKDTERLMAGLKSKYSYLEPFFLACRNRVHDPGWVCNSFGRYRRFMLTSATDKQAIGELHRQSMNFLKLN